MIFLNALDSILDEKHLLKHPFYQLWSCGKLSKDTLRNYAKQYFHHVEAFPRYVSATHSNCPELKDRQTLLENLIDEERGTGNHPELWLRFAEGLGLWRSDVTHAHLEPETRELVETFLSLSKSSFEEGLGALYAYERQVPEVAQSKIDGLKNHYAIEDTRALSFFQVHLKADVEHSEACRDLLNRLTPEQQDRAGHAAIKAANALWNFLDGQMRVAA